MFVSNPQSIRAAARTAVALAAVGLACLPARPDPPAPRAVGGHHAPFSGDPTPPMGIPLAPPPGVWLTRPWTGDSAPFIAAARDVSRQGRSRGNTEAAFRAVWAHEKAAALAAPLSLMAAYRWLVAATQVAYFSDVIDYDALDAVGRLDPGVFRQVARTRVAAIIGPASESDGSHPSLAGLEERLLRADPSDLWLREHVIRDLSNGRATQPRAVALADRWVRESPGSAKAHLVRAHTALLQWFASRQRDRSVAALAVAEYGQFLRLAPPDAYGRVGAKKMADKVAKVAGISVAAAPMR